jgi:curli biogenesis system outer membrane secretion channel CsgG
MLLHRTDVRKHVLTLLLHGILSLILALMSAGVLQAQTSVPASGTEKQTRTIIVLPFDFSAGFDTKVSDGLGKIIAQMMTASLVKIGEAQGRKVRVLDRSFMKDILEEQDLVTKNVVAKDLATKLQKKIGAGIAISGTITKFNLESKQRGIIDTISDITGIGGLFPKGTELHVAALVNVIDVQSGEIIYASKLLEEKDKTDKLDKDIQSALTKLVKSNSEQKPDDSAGKPELDPGMMARAGEASRKLVEKVASDLVGHIPTATAEDIEKEEVLRLPVRTLEVSGLKEVDKADKFLEELKKCPGIRMAEMDAWNDDVLTASVRADDKFLRKIGVYLASNPELKAFGLKLKTYSPEKIVICAKASTIKPPNSAPSKKQATKPSTSAPPKNP